jgi:hypothetical protein
MICVTRFMYHASKRRVLLNVHETQIMTTNTKNSFCEAFSRFYAETCNLESDFPHAWMDGFENMIRFGHTDHDQDNTYLPQEEPNYSNYKAGAKAAMIFLSLSA